MSAYADELRKRCTPAPNIHGPGGYVAGAVDVMDELRWLARPATAAERAEAVLALGWLEPLGVDQDDASPWVLLWMLHEAGALVPLPDLDWQLLDWRQETETRHRGSIAMTFLPPLPVEDTPDPEDGPVCAEHRGTDQPHYFFDNPATIDRPGACRLSPLDPIHQKGAGR